MNSRSLMSKVSTLSFGLLGGLALIAPACAGSPTCDDRGLCGGEGATSGSSGSNGTSGDTGASGDSGAGASGSSGTGGKGGSGASGSSNGGKSGMAGSAGSLGNAGAGGGGGSECDATKSPTEEGCLVSDEFAVFVSPSGKDDNDGTQGAPLATLTKAVEVAAGAKMVLVCDATYDEHVSITAGARVYGGFKCADWSAEAGKPLFMPTTGTALRIDTVADDVVVENVSFEVGNAVAPGETALAAIVNASPKVTFRGVSLKAGSGKTGASGTPNLFSFPDTATLDGYAESSPSKGGEKACACQTGLMSIGGAGGPPSSSGQNGAKGLPEHGGGLGGDPAAGDCGAGSSGKKGGNASAAGAANGATILGAASASGWQPTAGTDGATGSPGQGGGGGASLDNSGRGGGGGCGGCGGNGGPAGKGGGGSIALLALNSPLVLDASALVTADAGNGGSGVAGQAAKKPNGNDPAVGAGGGVVSSVHSCPGGNGGLGGDGGAGGGGAGGISVGIVWRGGTAPTLSADTTITNGKAGIKGTGGAPGNDGIAGVAQKILSLN